MIDSPYCFVRRSHVDDESKVSLAFRQCAHAGPSRRRDYSDSTLLLLITALLCQRLNVEQDAHIWLLDFGRNSIL